jgi:hypothetical protein
MWIEAGGRSPLEGELAAKRPEGVASGYAAMGVPSEATPSVGFADISPSRGERAPA